MIGRELKMACPDHRVHTEFSPVECDEVREQEAEPYSAPNLTLSVRLPCGPVSVEVPDELLHNRKIAQDLIATLLIIDVLFPDWGDSTGTDSVRGVRGYCGWRRGVYCWAG